jgi:hypothetical protein
MPRKKQYVTDGKAHVSHPLPSSPSPSMLAQMGDKGGARHTDQQRLEAQEWPRSKSYKTTLSLPTKGVTIGERNGHDWVISFPGDPGKETKDKLRDAAFEYHDYKWKVFTHAPNRSGIEELARELKRQHGEEIAVNDYPTRQVVLAFDAPPGEEITRQLKEAGFHFRSDMTWNADYTADNQKFARDLIQSLPTQSRSAQAGR